MYIPTPCSSTHASARYGGISYPSRAVRPPSSSSGMIHRRRMQRRSSATKIISWIEVQHFGVKKHRRKEL